jgi:hypothetical protein
MVIPIVFSILKCEVQAQFNKETSAPVRPSWIAVLPPDSREFRYFVGFRTGASSLEEGRESAVKDASGQIAGFLRSRLRTEYEETTTQIEQNLKQQISSRSTATISGAKVVEWYYEDNIRIEKEFRAERFDVWVLVAYPKEEVSREMDRQSCERRAAVRRALDWYRKGAREEKEKRYDEARKSYLSTINELNNLDEVTPVEGEFVDSAGLLRAAKDKSTDMIRRSRRLAIRCRIRGNDERYRQFVTGFTTVIISGNIEVGDDDPAYVVTGEVSVSEGGFIMGNYVAYATGSLEIRRIADGRTLLIVPLHVKGFHRIRDMAALNALKEGGGEVGESVVKAILANE